AEFIRPYERLGGDPSYAYLDAGLRHRLLGLTDGEFAVMEDRSRQHCVGSADNDAVDEILQRAHASRSDHRDIDGIGDGTRQGEVEAGLRAVAIHAGEQNFSRAEL